MECMVANVREALHTLADQFPEGATWKDAAYEAFVRQEIEASLEEARLGEFATDGQVKSAFAKWGVQVETEVDAPPSDTQNIGCPKPSGRPGPTGGPGSSVAGVRGGREVGGRSEE